MRDTETRDSFGLQDGDWLAVGQDLFANDDHRIVELYSFEDFYGAGVVEARFDGQALGFIVGDGEDRTARFFDDQRVGGQEKHIGLALDDDAHVGVHARTQIAFRIRQFDFRQHGFGRLIERVTEARDSAFKGSSRQFFNGYFYRQPILDERHLRLRNGNLDADFAEMHQGEQSRILGGAAGSGGRDKGARIDHPFGDDAGKWSNNFGKTKQSFVSLEVGFGHIDFTPDGINQLGHDQIGGLGLRFADAFEIKGGNVHLGFIFSAIGDQLGHFDIRQQSALF